MNRNIKINDDSKKRCEGSSLAIALFFCMVCSLLCASILYLANSTTRSVSRSYNYAQNLTFVAPPTPVPTEPPTPTPTPGPEYEAEVAAIDTVFSNLNYDFLNACIAADKGMVIANIWPIDKGHFEFG